jgi:FtsX-like permease family
MGPMGAGGMVARMLRRRLLGSLALIAVVTGVSGGLATGLVASAGRTRTAVDRLLADTHLSDVFISASTLTTGQVDALQRIPGVEGAALLAPMAMMNPGGEFVNIAASADGRYGVDVDVPRVVRGRAASPDSIDEIAVGEPIAELLGVDVGDVVRFDSYSPEQLTAWGEEDPTEEEMSVFLGPTIELDVVGITRHPADLTSDDPLSYFIALPPGFFRAYSGKIGEWPRFATVDIGESPTPAEEAAIASAAREIVGEEAAFEEAGEQAGAPLMTTLDFVAESMLALAAAVAVAGAVIGGLMVVRTVSRAMEDTAQLPVMGMTAGERARSVNAALLPAALVAGVLTFALAVASSAVLSFGLARRAEPDPGLRLDALVHTLGAVAATALVLGIVAIVVAGSVRRRSSRHPHANAVVIGLARIGLPVAPLVGVDLAIGSGRSRIRGTNHVATAAVAMATLAAVGALVLTASVRHLESTPDVYGSTWDFVVDDDDAETLVADPAVESVGLVKTGPISLDGRPVIVRGVTSLKGAVPVLVVDGRPPERGEIALGKRTMDDLDVVIGDTVVAHGAQEERRLQVVGEAVFAGIVDVPEAGWGAAVPLADFEALGSDGDTGAGGTVALADGVDPAEFARRVEAQLGAAPKVVEPPVELARLREVEAFPWILGGFLVAAGVVGVGHAIVTTVRRRRPDLAVLRSMGLVPGGVYQAIGAQALVLALVGFAIGIPLGVAAGQALWRALAGSLGVVVTVAVPWTAIVLAAAIGSAAVIALAVVPARTAAHTPIAAALRAE